MEFMEDSRSDGDASDDDAWIEEDGEEAENERDTNASATEKLLEIHNIASGDESTNQTNSTENRENLGRREGSDEHLPADEAKIFTAVSFSLEDITDDDSVESDKRMNLGMQEEEDNGLAPVDTTPRVVSGDVCETGTTKDFGTLIKRADDLQRKGNCLVSEVKPKSPTEKTNKQSHTSGKDCDSMSGCSSSSDEPVKTRQEFCASCYEGFPNTTDMLHHLAIHNKPSNGGTGGVPIRKNEWFFFTCRLCKKLFPLSCGIHKPFICNICKKLFPGNVIVVNPCKSDGCVSPTGQPVQLVDKKNEGNMTLIIRHKADTPSSSKVHSEHSTDKTKEGNMTLLNPQKVNAPSCSKVQSVDKTRVGGISLLTQQKVDAHSSSQGQSQYRSDKAVGQTLNLTEKTEVESRTLMKQHEKVAHLSSKGHSVHPEDNTKEGSNVSPAPPDFDLEQVVFKCNVCFKGYTSLEHLMKHLSSDHTGLSCQVCMKVVTDFESHMERFHKEDWRRAENKWHLNNFLRTEESLKHSFQGGVDPDSLLLFRCKFCQGIFRDYTSLCLHAKEKHAEWVRIVKAREKEMTTLEALGAYYCKECLESFQTRQLFDSHIETKHASCRNPKEYRRGKKPAKILIKIPSLSKDVEVKKERECNESKPDSNVQLNVQRSGRRKRYTCGICDMAFAKHQSMKRHTETFHPEAMVQCKICQRKCDRSSLAKHIKLMHPESFGARYACKICRKSLFRKNSLVKHMKNSHPNMFQDVKYCVLCQRGYGIQKHFAKHMVDVHGIAECEICKKDWELCTSITQHVEVHSAVKAQRKDIEKEGLPYKCETCHREFSTYRALNGHLVITHAT